MPFSTYQYAAFASQTLTTTSSTTLGTVPASTQWMVKDISVANTTSTAANITISLNGVPILPFISLPGNQAVHWTGLVVLAAGQLLTAQAGTANAIAVWVSGQTGV